MSVPSAENGLLKTEWMWTVKHKLRFNDHLRCFFLMKQQKDTVLDALCIRSDMTCCTSDCAAFDYHESRQVVTLHCCGAVYYLENE